MLHISFPLGSLSAPQTHSRIKESTSKGREDWQRRIGGRRLGKRERRDGKPQSSASHLVSKS